MMLPVLFVETRLKRGKGKRKSINGSDYMATERLKDAVYKLISSV